MQGAALLHSVSYSGSWGQAALPVDAFVDKAAELGFGGVMLMAKRPHLSVLDFDEAARRQLRQRLEARRLETVVVAGYTNFTADLEHTEIPHREIQIQYVVELARMARDLGGSLVRVFTGYDHPASNYAYLAGRPSQPLVLSNGWAMRYTSPSSGGRCVQILGQVETRKPQGLGLRFIGYP